MNDARASSDMVEEAAPIPFIDLAAQRRQLGTRLEEAMARVLAHGRYVLGPEVTALEEALQAFTGAGHCVTCASGTDALTLVLMAEGIGPGDAVIVPDFTFVATAGAVAQLGATPVFADVEPESFNLDPASAGEAVDAALQAGLSPRMIIAVDLFGQPADYAGLGELARTRGLRLVADAAQSLGAGAGGRMVGTLADWTTTSFFPAKPLGCYGDGGAVFVDDADKAALLRSLRVHGEGADKYDNVRVGLNSRLDTLQAAILLEKLRLFPGEIEARSRIAMRYGERMPDGIAAPRCAEGNSSVWAQYTVRLSGPAQREAVRNACKQAGIPTPVYYDKPLHRQTGYAHYPWVPGGLPVSEDLAQTVLSLPMHPYLDEATQDRIIAALAHATDGRR